MHAIPILLLLISSFDTTPPQPQPNITSLHPLNTPAPAPQVNSTSPTDATPTVANTDTAVAS